MKKLALMLALASFCTMAAQAETKVGTINLLKVFENYYKTRQADANLKDEAADKDKERKEMITEFRKGEDEWKKLLDQANDQAVAAEERDKSKKAAEKKLLELRELEQTIKQFETTTRAQIGEKMRFKREAVVQEIRTAVNAKAKANGYTFVYDVSAESTSGTPIILYSTGENDLTETILSELNSTAPAGVIKALDERKAKEEAEKKDKKDEKKDEKK